MHRPCPEPRGRTESRNNWDGHVLARPGMVPRKDHRIQTSKNPLGYCHLVQLLRRSRGIEIAHDCRGHDHMHLHSHFFPCTWLGFLVYWKRVEAEEQSCSPEPSVASHLAGSLRFHVSVRMGTKSQRHPAQGLPGLSFPKHSKATVLTGPQGPT